MTMYDIFQWNTGNTNAKCELLAPIKCAVRAASRRDWSAMKQYISQFNGAAYMYNVFCNQEDRIKPKEREKIVHLIMKVYDMTFREE